MKAFEGRREKVRVKGGNGSDASGCEFGSDHSIRSDLGVDGFGCSSDRVSW